MRGTAAIRLRVYSCSGLPVHARRRALLDHRALAASPARGRTSPRPRSGRGSRTRARCGSARAALRTSSSTWISVVLSSAVVGSSRIMRRGLPASAAAITTRWRCPPESSCGIAVVERGRDRAGWWRRRARASPRAPRALPQPRWMRTASATWPPTRRCGVSEESGFCGTKATLPPRSSLHLGGRHAADVAPVERDARPR